MILVKQLQGIKIIITNNMLEEENIEEVIEDTTIVEETPVVEETTKEVVTKETGKDFWK